VFSCRLHYILYKYWFTRRINIDTYASHVAQNLLITVYVPLNHRLS